MKDQEIIIN